MRSIRLDAFEPDYKSGGIDRGAVPTVSILDGAGTVLVKQRVYPNNMLHAGSLAINAPGVGLSVWLALLDPAGAETGRVVQYVDFSETAPEGTVADRALLPRRHPDRVQDDPCRLHRGSRRLGPSRGERLHVARKASRGPPGTRSSERSVVRRGV